MDRMEALIRRAAAALSFVPSDEAIESLVAGGIEPGTAYLAVRAATVYVKGR
jgi:hypothetical protein